MALLIIIVVISLVIALVGEANKKLPPKRTEEQKQTDELISVILPTIKDR
jgi:hypothetical protein